MVKVKMWKIEGERYPATKDDIDVCCPECRCTSNVVWPCPSREVDCDDDRIIFDFDRPVECPDCDFRCNSAAWVK